MSTSFLYLANGHEVPTAISQERLLHFGDQKLLLGHCCHSQAAVGQHKRLQAARPTARVQTVQLSPLLLCRGHSGRCVHWIQPQPAGKGEAQDGTACRPVSNARHRDAVSCVLTDGALGCWPFPRAFEDNASQKVLFYMVL